MTENTYVVSMKTPLGMRTGTMSVVTRRRKVSGYLDVLQSSEPFSGRVDEDGSVTISGQIVTLMRTIPYVARGEITPQSLFLILKGRQEEFELSGVARGKDCM